MHYRDLVAYLMSSGRWQCPLLVIDQGGADGKGFTSAPRHSTSGGFLPFELGPIMEVGLPLSAFTVHNG